MHKGEILNININKHLYGKSLNRDCIPRANFLQPYTNFSIILCSLKKWVTHFFPNTVFLDYFLPPKGGGYYKEDEYSREAIISNNAHWKLCPKYFVSLSH